MRRLRTSRVAHQFVVALYGLAMLLLPFAHRQLVPEPKPDLSAYAMPGGALPVICTTNGKDGKPSSASGHCDACRLTSAPGLLAAAPAVEPSVFAIPAQLAVRAAFISIGRPSEIVAEPRAPPRRLA